jgi:hypothetical protein
MATKPEQKMWDYLTAAMRGRWDAQRHEDKLSNSVPDVSFACQGVDGWLELKTIEEWPKRATTMVKLQHLRSGQVNWMEDRGRRGRGACWVLLAVGGGFGNADWVLIHHTRIRDLYDGKMGKDELLALQSAKSSGLVEMLLDAFSWFK